MAITTMDGLVAGFKPPQFFFKKYAATPEAIGIWFDLSYTVGMPGSCTLPTSGLAGSALTATVAGQIPVPAASNNTYIAGFSTTATQQGQVLLCDRLWHNQITATTTTTLQVITSGAMPSRDQNGSTNGEGVQIGLFAASAIGGGAVTNTTITYTNSAGTAGRTGTLPSWPATANINTFVPFALAAGDTGFRSFAGGSEGITLATTYTSGTLNLVAYRVLAVANVLPAEGGATLDAVSVGMPRLYDNSVPFLLFNGGSATAPEIYGTILYAQG